MADLTKTVKIVFSGDDRVSKTVNAVSGRIDALEASVQTIAEPLAAVADGVLKLDAALAVMAVGGLTYAYNKSMQFESAQVELQKVMGDNQEAVKLAAEAAVELSNRYGEAASEILLSTAEIKQAGFNVEEALTLTKNTMDLAIAGSMDAAAANEILIATLKGFDAPAADAARLIDILNAVSNEYATDVGELGVGIAKLSPILKQMGFSFEEGAGLLTPVIEVFRSGDEAANGLKSGLLNLISDTPRVTEALASIGVAQKDQTGTLRSAKDVLAEVQRAWAGLSAEQRVYITQELAGKEQAARMAVVFDTLAKQISITETALGAAGSATAEVEARLASSEVALGRAKAAWENLFVVIGDQFRDAADGAIDGATEIEVALQQIVKDGTFDPVFERLRTFADELGEFLSQVAEVLPEALEQVDLSPLLDALGEMGKEIERYFSESSFDSIDGLAKAIQGVVDTFASLANVTAGMIEGFRPVFEGLASMVEGFNDLDTGAQKEAGNILAAAKTVSEAGLLVAGAIIAMGDHADTIRTVFDVVINTISGAASGVKAVWKGVLNFFVDSAAILWEVIDMFNLGLFQSRVDDTRDRLKSLSDQLRKDFLQAAGDSVRSLTGLELGLTGVSQQADETKRALSDMPRIASEQIQTASEQIKAALADIPQQTDVQVTADDQASPTFEEVLAQIQGLPSEKVTVVTGKPDKPSINAAAAVVDQLVPAEKRLRIEADLDIERIRAQTDTIQTLMEWDAKVNIEQVKAATEQIKAAFESVNTSIVSTGDVLSSLFNNISDDLSVSRYMDIISATRKESDRRDQAFALQEKLTTAQVELLTEQRRQLETGGALIKISADGLEPELEAFMWKIIERIQIRGVESASEFLLGI